jgi:hypothetical protein
MHRHGSRPSLSGIVGSWSPLRAARGRFRGMRALLSSAVLAASFGVGRDNLLNISTIRTISCLALINSCESIVGMNWSATGAPAANL